MVKLYHEWSGKRLAFSGQLSAVSLKEAISKKEAVSLMRERRIKRR
jgi:hypothetical protein